METERRRALKVMHAHLFHSDEMRERFQREAKIAAQIESEHIADVLDAGVDEATKMPFLVMELLRGEDLQERIKRLGPRPTTEVLTCLRQVSTALDKTHNHGIVHRDLKPQNLFLTYREDGSPRIKILDFGIAKLVRDGSTEAGVTQNLGTPIYMAPEQFRVGVKLTRATDIYSLGMVAYTLLVGHAYWSKEAGASADVLALVLVAMQGPRESATSRARSHNVTLPNGFDGWFAKVTALDPSLRFQSASEAVNALSDVLTSTLSAAPLLTQVYPASSVPASQPSTIDVSTTPRIVSPDEQSTTSAAVTRVRPKQGRPLFIVAALTLGLVIVSCILWIGLGVRREKNATPISSARLDVTPAHESATVPPTVSPSSSAPASSAPLVVSLPTATPASSGLPRSSAELVAPPLGSGPNPATSASARAPTRAPVPSSAAKIPALKPRDEPPLIGRE